MLSRAIVNKLLLQSRRVPAITNDEHAERPNSLNVARGAGWYFEAAAILRVHNLIVNLIQTPRQEGHTPLVYVLALF